MKVARIHEAGGPEKIKIETIEKPKPQEGEVRIQVAYASLNPLDNHARAHRIKWMHPGFPFTPGFEYSGVVDVVGVGVDAALIGKRVACNGQWGGCSEYAIAKSNALNFIPDELDMKTGAAFSTCAYTAWLLVHSAANLKAGQTIAVHSAAGAVGSMLIQIAKSQGATVFALAGSAEKLDYTNQFGPDHLINYTDEKWPEQVKELTAGKGVNVIIDGNAGPNAPRNYEVIAPHGNIIYTGAVAGPAPDVNISMLIGKNCSVTGFVQYFHQAKSSGAEKDATHVALASGKWRIPIEKIYELDDLAQAHQDWEDRKLKGRTLIEINGSL